SQTGEQFCVVAEPQELSTVIAFSLQHSGQRSREVGEGSSVWSNQAANDFRELGVGAVHARGGHSLHLGSICRAGTLWVHPDSPPTFWDLTSRSETSKEPASKVSGSDGP